MKELGPRVSKEVEEQREYGVSFEHLEEDNGAIMLGIYSIYKNVIPGSKLTVEQDKLPKGYIHHLLREVRKIKEPDSNAVRLNWESDLSPNSFLWISRIPDREELILRFSFDVVDYLSDDAKSEAMNIEKDFDKAVNEYLKKSGAGVEI